MTGDARQEETRTGGGWLATDEAGVVDAVLDYFEGWFGGDADRVQRALHPRLAKRGLEPDGTTLDETSAQWMVDATGRGVGRARSVGDNRIEVTVDDLYGGIASATVRSAVYREYVQLVRIGGAWKIVNTLWQRTAPTGEGGDGDGAPTAS